MPASCVGRKSDGNNQQKTASIVVVVVDTDSDGKDDSSGDGSNDCRTTFAQCRFCALNECNMCCSLIPVTSRINY